MPGNCPWKMLPKNWNRPKRDRQGSPFRTVWPCFKRIRFLLAVSAGTSWLTKRKSLRMSDGNAVARQSPIRMSIRSGFIWKSTTDWQGKNRSVLHWTLSAVRIPFIRFVIILTHWCGMGWNGSVICFRNILVRKKAITSMRWQSWWCWERSAEFFSILLIFPHRLLMGF